MCGNILEKYDPRGKAALFKSVYALYSLNKVPAESISNYMSCACQLFSGLHGITINAMSNLFAIVKSDRTRFGALTDHFRSGDLKVVNADMDRINTLLEAI